MATRLLLLLLSTVLLGACDNTKPSEAAQPAETNDAPTIQAPPQNNTCDDPIAMQRIKDALSLEVLEGMTKEEARDWKPCNDCSGLTNQIMDTTYNNHCLLCVRRDAEYMGAYPSGATTWHCFNKKTGNRLRAADVFVADKMGELAKKCDEQLNKIIADGRKSLSGEELEYYNGEIEDHRPFTEKDLDKFYITAKGVTITYDLEFRHVVQNLQPAADMEWRIEDIKPYLKRDGPLSFMLQ